MKKLTAVFTIFLLVLSLCACRAPEPARQDLLEQTAENMKNVRSMRMDLNLHSKMAAEGIALPVDLRMKGETTVDPFGFHMDAKLGMMGLGIPVSVYAVQEEGRMEIYLGIDTGNGMQWETVREEIPSLQVMSMPDGMLPMLAALAGEPEQEKLGNTPVYTYRVELTRQNLQKMVDSGMLGSAEQAKQILEDMPEDMVLPFSFSVDPERKLLCGISVDLSQVLDHVDLREAGVELSEAIISIRYYDFNEDISITVPPQALAAAK